MGDDIAFEMRRSSSPTAVMNNYRQQEPITGNQTAVIGKEPVHAVAYNPLTTSLDQISGLVPTYATNMTTATMGGHPTTVTTTTTGYVNGGQSINFRPRHSEPDRNGLEGVGEVDFDTKCTDAYANLDDVRDRDYQSASRAPIYRGVANRSKEQKRKAKVSFCFCSFVIFIFALEVVILILAVFNLVNGLEVGSLTRTLVSSSATGSTSGQTSTVEGLSAMINNLAKELDRINSTLKTYQDEHGTNIDMISYKLIDLNRTVANLSSSNPGGSSQFVNVSVPLSREGCVTKQKDCPTAAVRTLDDGLGFSRCITQAYDHNETDTSVYLADVFCSMDRDDIIMPISASLIKVSDGYICICAGVEIPNNQQSELQAFSCFLHYTVCPSTVPVAIPLQ